jgi:hypothetical protein
MLCVSVKIQMFQSCALQQLRQIETKVGETSNQLMPLYSRSVYASILAAFS